ncbi:hypothetical protein INQ25_02110 [Wolbachia endosymbiont of Rhagoletis cerasi]|uniref:hypothetical protein n=1 Tax=Wolbachia endosymbiont of Rhagoletis cerasi TaxID=225363 RepID=UPI001BD64CAC|nr:hypothetical protein [Wolbachia endosymbiont of Rhagoletis cerasi]MBS9530197.1 hypothetical protein [Wolbachia endosymbiont of Rhagoletis cerasi]
MTPNVEFKDNHGTSISNLENVKIITLSDEKGNKYTLDASNGSLELKYKQNGQDEISHKVEGLAAAFKSLLDMKSTNNDEHTVLEEKLAEKSIVEAIFYAKDFDKGDRISNLILESTFSRRDVLPAYLDKKADVKNVYTKEEVDEGLNKKVDVENVYTKKEVDEGLNKKVDVENVYTKEEVDEGLNKKVDVENVYTKEDTDRGFISRDSDGIKRLASELFYKHEPDATSILVNTLGKLLDEKYEIYGDNKTAKDFLAEKGNFAKADGSNIKILEFTKKILDATEDIGDGKKKSILVEKLGRFLDQTADNENAYDGKIAKAFLGDKGVQGSKGADGPQGPAGRDGKSPSIEEVAVQLLTDENKDILGKTVLDITDSTGQNLATHVANKINLNSQDFINKADPIKLAELLFNKSNLDQLAAKKIAEDKVSSYKISELVFNDAKNALAENYQWDQKSFIEDIIKNVGTSRLAELLFNAGSIEKGEAKRITEGKVSPEKLAEYLFNASGLGDNIDESKTLVNNVTQHLLNTKVDEIGKAVVKDNENREILAGSRILQEGVAEKLISSNTNKLGQAILNVKNKFGNDAKPVLETHLANNSSFQEAVAGNQDLRTAVTANFGSNRDFCNIVTRDLSRDEESLLIDRLPFYEIPDDPNAPLSWN